ncbi:MAG: molybdopterin molybdotransferase MoeA, partial [Nitrospinae bacterium]|nr:molybdopterin molybdotransferase MoeA [Nitrospinota bacterium]
MIKVEEARKVVLESVKPVGIEKVEILLSIDRVLAEDIYSTLDLSPFDHSAMDGYAVISSDTGGASVANPKVLEVIEDIPAGYVASKELGQGQAARIMTGAPIPSGADAVIIVEDTEKEGSRVKIFSEVDRGENIRLRGEDVKKGELVIPKGKRIGPAEVGMLAALNIREVEVAKRPQVAILSTGDELVEVGEDLEPGKIRNSNSYSLYALVHKYGGAPTILGIAKDVKKEVEDKVR